MNILLEETDERGNTIIKHVFTNDEIRRTLVHAFMVDTKQVDLALDIVRRDKNAVFDLTKFNANGDGLVWSARLSQVKMQGVH